MFSLPFLQKNNPQSDRYIFMLFLSGEKAYGFAFDETDPENRSTLYHEHVDTYLKNAADKVEKILANVERDLGENVYLKKTVLVLNSVYTTESGAIREDFLKQIKKLLKSVDLDNLGYLNFYEVVSFHYRKKHPAFEFLEESIYDFALYQIVNGEVEQTVKIGKSQDTAGNWKEVTARRHSPLPLVTYFYKKPTGQPLEYKHLVEEGDLAGMLTNVYFKDKQANPQPTAVPESVSTPSQETVDTKDSELTMAPGFAPITPIEEAPVEALIPESPFTEPAGFPEVSAPKAKSKGFTFPKLQLPLAVGQLKWPILALVGVIVLLGGILGYYFLLHRAEIILSVKRENYSSDIKFTVNPQSTFTESFRTSLSQKVEATTTGEKVTGEKAKGEITVYNGLSEKRELPAGAIFKSGSVEFALDSAISVPAATNTANLDQGVVTKAFGKKTVNVTAKEIGAEGNLDSGVKLSYADISENDFYALANSDFNGGVKKTIGIFSSRDKDNLEKKVLALARTRLEQAFRDQHSSSDVLFVETINLQTVKKNYSAAVGEEATRVSLNMNGPIEAQYAPYRLLIKEVQDRKLKEKEFVEGTFNLAKIKLQESRGDSYQYTAVVKAQVQNLVDQSAIKTKLRMKPLGTAQKLLSGEHNITSAEIITKPLPLPLMPFSSDKMLIKFSR